MQFRLERLDCAQKRVQLSAAIAQLANVGDFAGEFATKSKRRRSQLDPAPDRVFVRHIVKCGIDFDCWKIARIKFEPLRFRQVGRIKTSAPVRKAPGTGADSNFLLIGKIQARGKSKLNRRAREDVDLALCRTQTGAVLGVAQLDVRD